ncbi:hypothetical protein SAMN04487983_105514 [Streptomyces sp. yr375]|uniref:hypothetical protein n=1 Tax=Streptomyces sp. yr375 TaxID=1761906 RepID=UPI0008D40FDA|nr:hypothetical protein [Streptomyces sp. yr375]SES44238.1 hypothetical protein SAMN04487983_105514 [Streptomyces sp. yr375]
MNLRLLALGGAVAGAIALPLAMASAGPAGDEGRTATRAAGPHAFPHVSPHASPLTDYADARADGAADARADGDTDTDPDPKAPPVVPSRSPLLLGLGPATAARCGPELTSPDGVEAQTCVLSQGEDTWARTYYRNATGRAVDAFLSLMGPAGRTVRTSCVVGAEDEPESCETPHERTRGELAAYTAVAEFARATDDGPLLLRSGSNSRADTGS